MRYEILFIFNVPENINDDGEDAFVMQVYKVK